MQKFSSFWQGSLDFLRQRIRMSIEYDMQKIILAVIIIVNFHKSSFECFWLDDGGKSTNALKAIYYIQGMHIGSPQTICCTILS